ncbi:hypothetical protein BKG75_16775 [Mycobacteroides chelonae]|nr:hypothetical protein BKG75_16775 [Mycobacteroides chelonae]
MSASASEDDGAVGGDSGQMTGVPRVNLANVLQVLEAAYQHGRSPSLSQIASTLDQSTNSGAFRARTAAASHYGFLTGSRGRLQFTDLGMRALDVDQRPAAMVEAWMNIALFRELFKLYDGGRLPKAPGIEADLRHRGVPEKNIANTRRVMMSSAEVAGLLNPARDRLVIPTLSAVSSDDAIAVTETSPEPAAVAASRSGGADLITVDFGNAGEVTIGVQIGWLDLAPEAFVELRSLIERMRELGSLQRKFESSSVQTDDEEGSGNRINDGGVHVEGGSTVDGLGGPSSARLGG